MNLIKILKLFFRSLKTSELAKHFEELLDKGLLVANSVRSVLRIESCDQLFKLFKSGVAIDNERPDCEKVEVPFLKVVLPPC